MGTPEFAAHFLEHLVASDNEVLAVVTQPDRPAGRGRVLTPPPVKVAAQRLGFTKDQIFQPDDLNSPVFESFLKNLNADLFVVVAFSILPSKLLKIAKYGAVNVHGSMLPLYRGASPVQRAIADGLKKTGVTVFRLDDKMDHGPILSKRVVQITEDDDTQTLLQKMVNPGENALDAAIKQIKKGRSIDLPQDHMNASPAPKIKKIDGLIDFNKMTSEMIFNRSRAFSSWPGVYFNRNNQVVYLRKIAKIKNDANMDEISKMNVGQLFARISKIHKSTELMLKTVDGALRIEKIQVEGKKEVAAESFICGCHDLVKIRE